MAFDPDAYLAKNQQGFDPDAYLAKKGVNAAPQQPTQPQAPAPSFYDRLRESLMGGLAGPIKAIPAFEGQVMNSVNSAVIGVPDMIPNLINAVSREANRFSNVRAMDNYDPNNGVFAPSQASQIPTIQGTLGQAGIGNQNYLPEGAPRSVANALGMGMVAAGGVVPVSTRNVGTLPGAVAEFTGMGSQVPLAPAAAAADKALPALLQGAPEAQAAGFKLEQVVNPGTLSTTDQGLANAGLLQRAVPDPLQNEALKQGFDRADVSFIAQMNDATRRKGLEMLRIIKAGKENVMNRFSHPSMVLGDSMLDRVKVVQKANRVAGEQLEGIAQGLQGKYVSLSDAQNTFMNRLLENDVVIDPKTGDLDFSESNFEGYKGVQDLLSRAYRRANSATDAYSAHKTKRYIDTQVTFGKDLDGLKGRAEDMLKELRHNIDSQLDANFDAYNKVNTHYSTTVQGLDELQTALGTRMDFNADYANKAAGTNARKILTNYQAGPEIESAFNNIESLARKYIAESDEIIDAGKIIESTGVKALDDDVLAQVALVDRFNKIFGASKAGSFEGIQQGAAQRTADMITNPKSAVIGYLPDAIRRARGINEENAIKAMEQLLRGNKP